MTELEIKAERLIKMMAAEGLDAVMLNAQHNFAWATGGGRNGVDQSRDNGVATLLFTRSGKRYIIASRIEMQRMLTEEVAESDISPVEFEWQAEKADGTLPAKLAASLLDSNAVIGADIPLTASIAAVEGRIAACRYVLTDEEIVRYRELGNETSAAFEKIIEDIKPGDTESEIAAVMRSEFGRRGIDPVVTLVAADERIARFRHPVPTDKRWDGTLLLVTCARRNGLIASMSRIISAGKASDELLRRTEKTAAVNAAIWNSINSGVTGAEIYHAADAAYTANGFAGEISLHHQGGACGYRTREWAAHPASVERVNEKQAFAFNPTITGSKVEETVIFADGSLETITASAKFPQITTLIDGCEFISPGILEI